MTKNCDVHILAKACKQKGLWRRKERTLDCENKILGNYLIPKNYGTDILILIKMEENVAML